MLETIFKMRLKKWTDAIAILDANTDNLHSDELEAIGALKNLWRTVSFGPSCTQRVERMVKVLSDADKLHGNNRDIIQASRISVVWPRRCTLLMPRRLSSFVRSCSRLWAARGGRPNSNNGAMSGHGNSKQRKIFSRNHILTGLSHSSRAPSGNNHSPNDRLCRTLADRQQRDDSRILTLRPVPHIG